MITRRSLLKALACFPVASLALFRSPADAEPAHVGGSVREVAWFEPRDGWAFEFRMHADGTCELVNAAELAPLTADGKWYHFSLERGECNGNQNIARKAI